MKHSPYGSTSHHSRGEWAEKSWRVLCHKVVLTYVRPLCVRHEKSPGKPDGPKNEILTNLCIMTKETPSNSQSNCQRHLPPFYIDSHCFRNYLKEWTWRFWHVIRSRQWLAYITPNHWCQWHSFSRSSWQETLGYWTLA